MSPVYLMDIDAFQLAGKAACLLEEMGFVAVARRCDGVVTLEYWRVVNGTQRAMRVVVDPTPTWFSSSKQNPHALASACAAQFRAASLQHQC